MPDFLAWIEASALGVAIRQSGVWTYALVNLAHILGVASLFGSVLVIDLRLLGVWRVLPLGAVTGPTVPLAGLGFLLAATSGVCLLAANGTDYIGNPFLYIKFPAIALGLCNVLVLNVLPAWRARKTRDPSAREERQLALTGGMSLICWLTALSAGRMIGYW